MWFSPLLPAAQQLSSGASADFSAALNDGDDALSSAVSPAVSAAGSLAEGADSASAFIAPTVSASSATTDGADTLAAVVALVGALDFSGALLDGPDSLAAAVDSGTSTGGAGNYGGATRKQRRAMARALGPWKPRESDVEQLARLLTGADDEPTDAEPVEQSQPAQAVDSGAMAYVATLQRQIAQAQAEIDRRQQAIAELDRLDAAARMRRHAAAQVQALVMQAMQRQEQARRELEEIDMAYVLAALLEEA